MAALRRRRATRGALVLLVGLGAIAAGRAASATSSPDSAAVALTAGGGVWAPDGDSIARVVEGGIEVATPVGRRLRVIRVPTPVRGLAWTEDGKTILFVSKEADQKPDRTERVGSVRLGGRPRFSPVGTHIGSLGWSPGGWPLVFATTSLYIDIERGPVGPEPALWQMGGPHQEARRILDLPGEERFPRVSPDGGSIIFGVDGDAGANGLWLLRRDRSGTRRLVPGIGGEAAAWSPNGSLIAFSGAVRHDRRHRLYVVSAGGGPLRRLSAEEVLAEPPAWSPDGDWITYSNYAGEVRRIHPDGSGAETIADFPGREVRQLSWSPDGTRLAYTAEPIYEGD